MIHAEHQIVARLYLAGCTGNIINLPCEVRLLLTQHQNRKGYVMEGI